MCRFLLSVLCVQISPFCFMCAYFSCFMCAFLSFLFLCVHIYPFCFYMCIFLLSVFICAYYPFCFYVCIFILSVFMHAYLSFLFLCVHIFPFCFYMCRFLLSVFICAYLSFLFLFSRGVESLFNVTFYLLIKSYSSIYSAVSITISIFILNDEYPLQIQTTLVLPSMYTFFFYSGAFS